MEQLSKEQIEQHQLAEECMDEALRRLYEGNLKEAETIAIRARDTFEKIQDKVGQAAALNRLSVIYDEMGDESMDLKCLLDALDIVEDSEDNYLEAKLYNNLGSRFMNLRSYDRALNCFLSSAKALDKVTDEYLEQSPDTFSIHSFRLILNLNFSFTYYHLGDLENAKKHFDFVKKESEHWLGNDQKLITICFEGLTLWRFGEKEKVKALLEPIIETVRETDYATDYLETMSYLIELLKDMGEYEKWEQVLLLMDQKLSDDAVISVRVELLNYWLEFYSTTGNTEKYMETCVKFYELSKEKLAEDYSKRADHITLQMDMRSTAKQKKHDETIVYRDALTGIGNRNKMINDSIRFISESVENKTMITIGLIDIDFFKECNDTYGHIEGDSCLKKVASTIENAVSGKGFVYRYGGDEFVLLLPKISEADIEDIGASIKSQLEAAKIPNERSSIAPFVTVSQGYAMARAEEGDTIETLVNLADLVLYSVKRRGRNGYSYTGYKDILNGQAE